MDSDLLRSTWNEVAGHGAKVPKVFYSILFYEHPDTRALFPNDMAHQRDKFVRALGRVVANVDQLDAAIPLLQRLGRDHRRFGAIEAHYAPVGACLLATLAYFLEDAWAPEIAEAWADAYSLVSAVMIDAAREADQLCEPHCWDAQILHVELNRPRDRAFVAFTAPEGLAAEPDMVIPAALHANPGGWLHLQPFPVDGGWAAYVDIDDNPLTLALSQSQPGDLLRLGQPGQPIAQLLEDS
jgi:hemoglobin-like flavoprotein